MQMSESNSKKFENFMMALQTLMREHDVLIYPEMYDTIQVWDFTPMGEVSSLEMFMDRTKDELPH